MRTNHEVDSKQSTMYLQLLRDQYTSLQAQHADLAKKYDLLAAANGVKCEKMHEGLAGRLLATVVSLCENPKFSDVTFLIGDKSIASHRLIVAVRSTYWTDLHTIHEIRLDNDTNFDTFNIVYRWMYTDDVDLGVDDKTLLDICHLASRYQFAALQRLCVAQLSARLNVSNCIDIYEFAERESLQLLRDACAAMVASQWKEFTPRSFANLAAPILYRLLVGHSSNVLHSIVEIGREDVLFLYFMENSSHLQQLVNETEQNGATPLELSLLKKQDAEASKEGVGKERSSSIASQLIEKGADVNVLDQNGNSLLDRMFSRDELEACRFLADHDANTQWRHAADHHCVLHTMASSSDVTAAFCDWVIENAHRFDVDAKDDEQRTPLMRAIGANNEVVIDALLKMKANVRLSMSDGRSPLWQCLFLSAFNDEKRLQLAEQLQLAGADVDCRVDEVHLLYTAIERNDERATRFLLAKGADVNATTSEKKTVFHAVAESGNNKLLKTLIEGSKGIKWSTDNSGRTPLQIALEVGHMESAKMMIKGGAPINEVGADKNSHLVRAVLSGSDDTAFFLLECKADARARDAEGKSCLELAAERGLLATTAALLFAGAPVNQRCSTGYTVIERSLRNGHVECASVLADHGCDLESVVRILKNGRTVAPTNLGGPADEPWSYEQTLLHSLLDEGLQEAAVFLIERGCNVNTRKTYADAKEDDLATPLHMAVSWGLNDVLKALVERPAQLDAQDVDGRTACHIAVRERNLDGVKILLTAPEVIFIGIRDKIGNTPLSQAILNLDHKVAAAIVERQPHAAAQTNGNGENLLHIAIEKNKLENVLFLLGVAQADASRPVGDGSFRTPLHLAAVAEDEMIIRNLILTGCELNARMKDDLTPLHEALRTRNAPTAAILLENGADPNLVDDRGENALHYAVRSGYVECIRVVLVDGRVRRRLVNRFGQTTLHICAGLTADKLARRTTSAELAEMLLTFEEKVVALPVGGGGDNKELAAFIDAKDASGSSALLLAYAQGNAATCRSLLKRGACMGSCNVNGISVFTFESATKQLLFGLLEWLEHEPRWSDGDSCDCGARFSLTQRKHHCRHCGRHVCSKCSETTMPIVKYSEEKRVRVCELCAHVLSGGSSNRR